VVLVPLPGKVKGINHRGSEGTLRNIKSIKDT
jgi:hypothetical protein